MSALAEKLGVSEEPPASGEPEPPEKDEKDGKDDPKREMAETLLEAIREEDPEAVVSSLTALVNHISSTPDEGEGPESKSPMHDLLGLSGHEE